MTSSQKRRNRQFKNIINIDRVTIYESFENLVRKALQLQAESEENPTVLYTDEHKSYSRFMATLSADERSRLKHRTVSSKRARTLTNPLFSVNYIDREIRKDVSDHVRETVQFSRNANNMMERLAIYRFYHNFMKPYRINGKAFSGISHGMMAGIPEQEIKKEMKTLFTRRRFFGKQGNLDLPDRKLWCRCIFTPGSSKEMHLPDWVTA